MLGLTSVGRPSRPTTNVCFRIWRRPVASILGRRSSPLGVTNLSHVGRSLPGRLFVCLGLRLLGSIGGLASFALPALETVVSFAWRVGYSGKSDTLKDAVLAPRVPCCSPKPILTSTGDDTEDVRTPACGSRLGHLKRRRRARSCGGSTPFWLESRHSAHVSHGWKADIQRVHR
jgi:hypothetical protein